MDKVAKQANPQDNAKRCRQSRNPFLRQALWFER